MPATRRGWKPHGHYGHADDVRGSRVTGVSVHREPGRVHSFQLLGREPQALELVHVPKWPEISRNGGL